MKYAVRLRDRRGRDREQKLLIEGYRALRRALETGYPVERLFFCETLFQGGNEAALMADLAAAGTALTQTTEVVFRKMAYRDRPEGLLGIAPRIRRGLADVDLAILDPPPLLLVAEGIEKPGNLGTMLRCADAVGVTALVLCDGCTDLSNPNVVRASTGNLFTVTVAEATAEETREWLREHGVRTLAASPHGERLYTEADMTGPLGIVVGAEQYGLTRGWLAEADLQVRIPMFGTADSLNVATAAALLLYEAARQRLAAGILADKGAVPESGATPERLS